MSHTRQNTSRYSALLAISLLSTQVSAWAPGAILSNGRTALAPSIAVINTAVFSTADPCWQDNYDADDDCLSTVYSAAFAADEWIKSMPAILSNGRTALAPSIAVSNTAVFSTADPCWQDNYDADDDCLSTVYSAAFVADEWIKSMPCGKDADCLPEELSHPGTMEDSGVEKVDVMEFLNIKKATPITSAQGGEE